MDSTKWSMECKRRKGVIVRGWRTKDIDDERDPGFAAPRDHEDEADEHDINLVHDELTLQEHPLAKDDGSDLNQLLSSLFMIYK